MTTKGDLSKQEALKSLRDAVIISVSGLLPQALEILNATDFGEYTPYVSLVLAIIAPLLNRFLNLWRV